MIQFHLLPHIVCTLFLLSIASTAATQELKDDESALTIYVDGRGIQGPPTLKLTAAWSGGQREPWTDTLTGADDGQSELDLPQDKLYLAQGRVPRAEFLAVTLVDGDGATLGARRTPLPSSQNIRILLTPGRKGVLTLQLLESEGPPPTLESPSSAQGSPQDPAARPASNTAAASATLPFGPWALFWTLSLGGLALFAAWRSQMGEQENPNNVEKPPYLLADFPLKHAEGLNLIFGSITPQKNLYLLPDADQLLKCTLDLVRSIASQGVPVLLVGMPDNKTAISAYLAQMPVGVSFPSSSIRLAESIDAVSPQWLSAVNPIVVSLGNCPSITTEVSMHIHLGPADFPTGITPLSLAYQDGNWSTI